MYIYIYICVCVYVCVSASLCISKDELCKSFESFCHNLSQEIFFFETELRKKHFFKLCLIICFKQFYCFSQFNTTTFFAGQYNEVARLTNQATVHFTRHIS